MWPWSFHHSHALESWCAVSMAYSLAVFLRVSLFCSTFFTTLFVIYMKFEYLSILKIGQVLLSWVLEVRDFPEYDKFHLNSIEFKLTLACWTPRSLLRAIGPTWRGGFHCRLSSLQNLWKTAETVDRTPQSFSKWVVSLVPMWACSGATRRAATLLIY